MRTEKFTDGEKLQCGMLAKNDDDFNFYRTYFENNRIQMQACNSLRMNKKEEGAVKVESSNIFAANGGFFKAFLYYTLGILGVLLLCGTTFELLCQISGDRAKAIAV